MPNERSSRLNAALAGRYRVERELGEGGMATVYLAEDVKHERKVALKVLKPELAAVIGAERFLSEIKTTANLQHPHILPLHDSGEVDGLLFYVMPYVEGESLRDRLDREHQLPVADAVRIATNMAEALDYAHRQGVIHRDIKPANVLLQEGKPVISDFGIALAVSSGGGSRLTETGLSLGTPHYMSPEQATGDQHVGKATDVYALGCVLYEMLAGEPPFTGSTPQAILGRIIMGEPPQASAERPSVPPNVDAAVRKALEKLPADRFASAGELAAALADPGFAHGRATPGRATGPTGRWAAAGWVVAAVAIAIAAWAVITPSGGPASGPVAVFPSPFLPGQEPTGQIDISADGSTLVYEGPAPSGHARQIWVRRWEDLEARPIPGTEGQIVQFAVSDDGTEVAFIAKPIWPRVAPLRVAPVDGGQVRTLTGGAGFLPRWGDGEIFFTGPAGGWVVRRVPLAGGEATSLTVMDSTETFHSLWSVSKRKRVGLVMTRSTPEIESSRIWAVDLDTGERGFIAEGHSPRYAASGHLLFVRPSQPQGNVLLAVPLDGSWMKSAGPPIVVAEGLATEAASGSAKYDISDSGTLVYVSGDDSRGAYQLTWLDRAGAATPVDDDDYFHPGVFENTGWQISPDGRSVALQRFLEGDQSIWIKRLPDGALERRTFEGDQWMPRWSPGGHAITFRTSSSLRSVPASGSEAPRDAMDGLDRSLHGFYGFWGSVEEDLLVLFRGNEIFAAQRDSAPRPLVQYDGDGTCTGVTGATLSHDGRWLAYALGCGSDREVMVQPFPHASGALWQISTGGGQNPVWAHNGRELFYVRPESRELVAVEYEAGATFEAGTQTVLFEITEDYYVSPFADMYDVANDDRRFLMARYMGAMAGARASVVVVQNFFEVLKERVGNGGGP